MYSVAIRGNDCRNSRAFHGRSLTTKTTKEIRISNPVHTPSTMKQPFKHPGSLSSGRLGPRNLRLPGNAAQLTRRRIQKYAGLLIVLPRGAHSFCSSQESNRQEQTRRALIDPIANHTRGSCVARPASCTVDTRHHVQVLVLPMRVTSSPGILPRKTQFSRESPEFVLTTCLLFSVGIAQFHCAPLFRCTT